MIWIFSTEYFVDDDTISVLAHGGNFVILEIAQKNTLSIANSGRLLECFPLYEYNVHGKIFEIQTKPSQSCLFGHLLIVGLSCVEAYVTEKVVEAFDLKGHSH